ncbi:recombinase RecF [Fervidicella metallireducens AeB]|uniref:DNA replication and repair protein RecF n=1 Tax=Fervidicella metallireducens AeB TaxID=1403537 RepID=A0A017RVM2_9CLOT|nr:DNA replication/repair protein RecF [Fervidicella metallireducens]EYE88636.1 recombinase RecF [Fervidicella metallireducens AeB]
MHVKNLELKNYRNYSSLSLNLNKGLNIFVGENAQGKTNIVESIYYLSGVKSHRTSRDSELIKWDKDRAYIKADVVKAISDYTMEFLLSNEEKKAIKVNGIRINKISEVLGTVNVVIFSPEDLKLVKEGPAFRRKFIDNELNQIRPKYHHALLQYNRVLMQRNNLLKSIKFSPSNRITAEVFSEQLAEYGSFLCDARNEFIKKLSLIARLIHRKITNGKEELEIIYDCSIGKYKNKQETKKWLLKYYIEEMDTDIERGVTLKGPHRDDLIIKINGFDTKIYGSQGQQRTAALSLKLSEIEIIKSEVSEYPILILDDVMSELDLNRQKFLLESLKDVQTILTCTSLNDINAFHFDNKDVFIVKNGNISKLKDINNNEIYNS